MFITTDYNEIVGHYLMNMNYFRKQYSSKTDTKKPKSLTLATIKNHLQRMIQSKNHLQKSTVTGNFACGWLMNKVADFEIIACGWLMYKVVDFEIIACGWLMNKVVDFERLSE